MQGLTAQSFAEMVYWLFVLGVVMLLAYFLERVYRVSHKWAIWIILVPPLGLLFIKRNWEDSRGACFFFLGFYLFILFAGALTGDPMFAHTNQLLQRILLWPIYLLQWLGKQEFMQAILIKLIYSR